MRIIISMLFAVIFPPRWLHSLHMIKISHTEKKSSAVHKVWMKNAKQSKNILFHKLCQFECFSTRFPRLKKNYNAKNCIIRSNNKSTIDIHNNTTQAEFLVFFTLFIHFWIYSVSKKSAFTLLIFRLLLLLIIWGCFNVVKSKEKVIHAFFWCVIAVCKNGKNVKRRNFFFPEIHRKFSLFLFRSALISCCSRKFSLN